MENTLDLTKSYTELNDAFSSVDNMLNFINKYVRWDDEKFGMVADLLENKHNLILFYIKYKRNFDFLQDHTDFYNIFYLGIKSAFFVDDNKLVLIDMKSNIRIYDTTNYDLLHSTDIYNYSFINGILFYSKRRGQKFDQFAYIDNNVIDMGNYERFDKLNDKLIVAQTAKNKINIFDNTLSLISTENYDNVLSMMPYYDIVIVQKGNDLTVYRDYSSNPTEILTFKYDSKKQLVATNENFIIIYNDDRDKYVLIQIRASQVTKRKVTKTILTPFIYPKLTYLSYVSSIGAYIVKKEDKYQIIFDKSTDNITYDYLSYKQHSNGDQSIVVMNRNENPYELKFDWENNMDSSKSI